MSEYRKKLMDPRWQKKRLEVMERDGFTCQHCGRTDRTLTVHHVLYTKGRDPWEYVDSNFITLCVKCHSDLETYSIQEARRAASYVDAGVGFELFCRIQNAINELRDGGSSVTATSIIMNAMFAVEEQIEADAEELAKEEIARSGK